MSNGTINDLITFFLWIIPVGAIARVMHCLILISGTSDGEEASYKKRAKNVIVFAIVAECIAGVIALVSSYYR